MSSPARGSGPHRSHPGEFGYDGWPKDAYKEVGGINVGRHEPGRGARHHLRADRLTNLRLLRRRSHGSNLFGNCSLALDARTGKRLWHHWSSITTSGTTTTPHRRSDHSAPQRQKWTSWRWPARRFPHALNRVMGEPLWPIEERRVPQPMFRRAVGPTQPFPTVVPPFARQAFTVADISPYRRTTRSVEVTGDGEDFSHRDCSRRRQPPTRCRFRQRRGCWGSTAADPAAGMVYVLSKDEPTMLKLERSRLPGSGSPQDPIGRPKVLSAMPAVSWRRLRGKSLRDPDAGRRQQTPDSQTIANGDHRTRPDAWIPLATVS